MHVWLKWRLFDISIGYVSYVEGVSIQAGVQHKKLLLNKVSFVHIVLQLFIKGFHGKFSLVELDFSHGLTMEDLLLPWSDFSYEYVDENVFETIQEKAVSIYQVLPLFWVFDWILS